MKLLDFSKLLALLTFSFLFQFVSAQQDDTICIDFGNSTLTSLENWNNVTGQSAGSIPDMFTLRGYNTGIGIAVTNDFQGINTSGLDADASLGIISNGAGDSFYGSDSNPLGEVTISGLDLSTTYSIAIYASRSATDNRTTVYSVTGSTTQVDSINVANNTTDLAKFVDMLPAGDGTITISVEKGATNDNGSGYFYLGAMKIMYYNTYVPGNKEMELSSPNGGEIWEVGGTAKIGWSSLNVAMVDLEYSSDNGSTWTSITTDVAASQKSYDWTVPNDISDNCLVRILDASDATVGDTSDAVFSIIADLGVDYHIVVLGSSTAAGSGPTTVDSAWVWMYRDYLTTKYTNFSITNRAVGGFNTRRICPDGYPEAATSNNITYALSLNPDAIIINLPSNDAAGLIPVTEQLANYDTIAKLCAEANVPLWVTTPQPRNFGSANDAIQLEMVDSTFSVFGDKAIDFWTGCYEEDGTWDVKDIYDSGDGVHQNNAGHKEMVSRMIAMNIDLYLLGTDPTYSLTVNNGTGDGNYEEAEIVTITADAPATGQEFDAWTGDVVNVDDVSAASTTITMPAAAATITATYVDLTYTITFNVDTNGTALEDAAVTFNSETINTDASGHAVFNDVVYGTGLAYSIVKTGFNTASGTIDATSDATENVTMTLTPINTYTVTFTVNDGTDPIQGANVNFNSQNVLTNASGQAIFSGISNGTGLAYTVTMSGYDTETGTVDVTGADVNETVSLSLTPVYYTLTVSYGSGGGTYAEGASISITAISAPIGEEFSHWSGDNQYLDDTTAITASVTMPAMDITIRAEYKTIPVTYTLTVNGGSGSGSFEEGETVMVVANPPGANEEFGGWTGDNQYLDDALNDTAYVTMPAADVTIASAYDDIIINVNENSISVDIYPNPAINKLNISASKLIANIRIIDITGKTVVLKNTESQNCQVDVSALQGGIYFLQLGSNGRVLKTIKIVIQ